MTTELVLNRSSLNWDTHGGHISELIELGSIIVASTANSTLFSVALATSCHSCSIHIVWNHEGSFHKECGWHSPYFCYFWSEVRLESFMTTVARINWVHLAIRDVLPHVVNDTEAIQQNTDMLYLHWQSEQQSRLLEHISAWCPLWQIATNNFSHHIIPFDGIYNISTHRCRVWEDADFEKITSVRKQPRFLPFSPSQRFLGVLTSIVMRRASSVIDSMPHPPRTRSLF